MTALAAGDVWLKTGADLLLFGPAGGGKTDLGAAVGLALVEDGGTFSSYAPPIWCSGRR